MREYLGPMHSVEPHDFRHGPADGEGTAHNRASAGSRDQVETEPQIKRRFATNPAKLISQPSKKGGRVDAAHASAIETEHSIRSLNLLIFGSISHSRDLTAAEKRLP